MINCSTFLKTLKDYISGELSEDAEKLSNEHISTCSNCKKIYDEQFKIYESFHSIAANPPADFSSSRNEIFIRIDKTRYSKKLLSKAGFFFRRNSMRYAVSGIALILLISISPYIYNNFLGGNKVIISNSKDVKQNKLDIINDIEYISLLQEGEAKGAYLDKVIFADKDNTLTEKIKDSILSGKIIEDTSTISDTSNPLIIGIKQKDGTYLEGEYKDGKVAFTKPAKITVKTDVRMEQIMQDFKARKLITSPQDIKFSGQVRNNKIVIERTKTYSFGEDSVFKNFKGSDKKPTEYEQALLKEAVSIGIDEKKLSNALAKAKKYTNNNIMQYPVIIDTGVYRDKACFILTFTWEEASIIKDKNKVQNLGHVFTVIMDEEGNEVSYATCS